LGKIDTPFFGALKKEKREKRRRKYAILRGAGRRAWGAYVEFVNKPVQLTASASPGPAPSGGGRIPPLRRYVSVPGAAYDLHCAYLGEPAPRKVECESEQADALYLHKCATTTPASLSISGIRPVGVCVGFDAGLYRWRWLRLLQRLDPPPLLSNLKPSLLHVSGYLLNCLLSIGAVLST
jgi:hypothetical protein